MVHQWFTYAPQEMLGLYGLKPYANCLVYMILKKKLLTEVSNKSQLFMY